MLLEDHGFRVSICNSYDCGHKRLQQKGWDAAVIEMELGNKGAGLRLAKEAKTLARAPLVVLSAGYPTVETLREALLMQVDYVHLRPEDAAEITRFLQREFARRQAVNERGRSSGLTS